MRVRAVVAGTVAVFALSATPTLSAKADKVPISGGWSGMVHDTAANSDYETQLSIDDKLEKGKKGGESFYPEFDCGGNLILKKHKAGSAKYMFVEDLKSGDVACVDRGEVTLKRDGTKLSYHWEKKGVNGDANGLLKRLKPE